MRVASNIEADQPRCQLADASLCSRAEPPASTCRQRALALSISLALTQLWQPHTARAEPELALQWSTPSADASCPDAAWATARIEAQLGRTPAANVAHGVSASVQIAATPRGFSLALQTSFQGQSGSRTLEGARCAELADAAILIISLSVSEASEQIAAAPTSAPQGAAATSASAVAPEQGRAQAAPSPSLEGLVRADAVLQVGLWSRVALGPGLSLGLTRGMFRGEVGGIWFPPLTLEHEGRDIRATLGAGRALGCLLFGRGRVQGGGCAGIEFGGVSTRTRSGSTSKDAHTWWSAATLGGRLHVRLIARLSLVASAEMLVGLTRLRFSSEDPDTGKPTPLYTAQPVQLRASLGPELRF